MKIKQKDQQQDEAGFRTGPVSREEKPGSRRAVFFIFYFMVMVAALAAGILIGLCFAYMVDLPEVQNLEDYQPSVVTEILADNNEAIGQFFIERRKLVSPQEVPVHFRNAVIAVEDKNFYSHFGVDVGQVIVSAVDNFFAQKIVRGASTITMQLSKQLFLTPEISWSRKIKEALLAIQIEKLYSKEQIFTMYANKIPFAHGNYGIASAAEYYFDKDVQELTVAECALLGAIIRTPERYSPQNNPELALNRRNLVLNAMREQGYLSEEHFQEAIDTPVVIVRNSKDSGFAAYFQEWVRQYLQKNYSTKQIYSQGLKVYTTMNMGLQSAAEKALQNGLLDYDKRNRWRGGLTNVLEEEDTDLETYRHPDWKGRIEADSMIYGLVMSVEDQKAVVRFGEYSGELVKKGISWTRKRKISEVLTRGDLALFRIQSINDKEKRVDISLEQEPEVEGSFMAIDNQTGGILAMVGGYDFERSKFNCATQAYRQTGSIFKPFVYTTALLNGMLLDDLILDEPFTILLPHGEEYTPRNFKGKYRGEITLREALAKSVNIPAVRLGLQVGLPKIIETTRKFGVYSKLNPYPSTTLGASEISLTEMVSAFSVFPNEGLRIEPFFIRRIEDLHGNVLEEHTPVIHEVIPVGVAHDMTTVLREVVQYGTSMKAKALNAQVAGKTGTTNDYTNAWFVGFTPGITAGVWVGFLKDQALGDDETGARAALPIWIEFMEEYLRDRPEEKFPENTTPLFAPVRDYDDEENGEDGLRINRRRKVVEEDIRQ